MRKVIAAINMTLDGFCDHTAGIIADEELHNHYADLLNNAGVLFLVLSVPLCRALCESRTRGIR